MGMDLGLVGSCTKVKSRSAADQKLDKCARAKQTCAHNPFSVFTHANTLTSFLELEILEQFNPIRILRVILKTALSPSCKPFRKRSRSIRPGNGIYRDLRLI